MKRDGSMKKWGVSNDWDIKSQIKNTQTSHPEAPSTIIFTVHRGHCLSYNTDNTGAM